MNDEHSTTDSHEPEPARHGSERTDDALEQSIGRGYELRDISVRGTVLAGIGLLVLLSVTMGGVYWGLRSLVTDPATTDRRPVVSQFQTPPVMFEDQAVNQEYYRKRQQAARTAVLNDYSWVDREQAIARIPIDEAIEILAQREDLGLENSSSEGSPP